MTRIQKRRLTGSLAILTLLLACAIPALAQESVSAPTHSVSLSPNRVFWGETATATVTLASPAPSGGQAVGVSTSRTEFPVVGDQVKVIPQGQTTATFQVRAQGDNRSVWSSAQVYANLGGISRRSGDPDVWVRIYGDPLNFMLTVSPDTAAGVATLTGTASMGTMTLMPGGSRQLIGNRPAPVALVISLSAQTELTVPASVTIPAGQMSVTFQVGTQPVSQSRRPEISGRNADGFAAVAYANLSPLAVASVGVNPASLSSGTAATATVTLNGRPGQGGFRVGLTAYGAATVPGDVTVPSGATSTTFPVLAEPVSGQSTVTLEAYQWLGPGQMPATGRVSAQFRVVPGAAPSVWVTDLTVSPTTGLGGQTLTAQVKLSGAAPSGGAMVGIWRGGSCCLDMPTMVTVPAGSTTANFSIGTFPTAEVSQPKVSARYGGQSKEVTLTVQPPVWETFALRKAATAPVYGPSTQNATIALSAPAPEGGLRFFLAASILGSSDRGATVPAEVRVAQGQTSVDFQVAFNAVSVRRQVTLTASGLGTQRKEMTINVDPAPPQMASQSQYGQAVTGMQTTQVLTATATGGGGGSGGNPFTSDCGGDGAMVGIRARAGSLVDSVQAVCVKVNSNGSWAGGYYDGAKAGGSGGNPVNLLCDEGWAVMALFGKAGAMVDSVGVRCGKMGAADGAVKIVSGSTSRGPSGGTGGNAFDQPCSSARIAKGITGRAGTLVDQIAIACHTPTPQSTGKAAAPAQAPVPVQKKKK
jgi:hypothetical protein